jgi:hypothetical protein
VRSLYRVSGPLQGIAAIVAACPEAEVLVAFLVVDDLVDAYVYLPLRVINSFLNRCDDRGFTLLPVLKRLPALDVPLSADLDDHDIQGWETEGGR